MATPQDYIQRIESAGYRVTGVRESIGDGQDGPLIVTAENVATGDRHTVTSHMRGSDGELEALQLLAVKVGVRSGGDRS